MSITSWFKERKTIVPKENQVGKYEFRGGFYQHDITQIMEEFSKLGKDNETIISGIKVMIENTRIINRQIDSRVELIKDQNNNFGEQIVVLNSLLESERKARAAFEERLEKRMTEFHKLWFAGMKTIVDHLNFLRSGATGSDTQQADAGGTGGTFQDGKAESIVAEGGDKTSPSLVGVREATGNLVIAPSVAEIKGLPHGLTDAEIDQVLSELPGDLATKESAAAEGMMNTQAEETQVAEEKAKEKPEPRPKKIFTWEDTVIKRQEVVLLTTKAGRLQENGSGRESLESTLETLIQREHESGVKWVADSLRESLKALRKRHLEKVIGPLGKIMEKLDGVKNGATGTLSVEADEMVTNETAQMDGEDLRLPFSRSLHK